MIVELTVPLFNPNMAAVVIEVLHQREGATMKPGDKLMDVSVMLGANFAQDCPPLSYFRLVVRERAILRRLLVEEGSQCSAGSMLALFTTDPDEPFEQPPERALRCISAGIMYHEGMFSGRAAG